MKLILASASPRRVELLKQFKHPFESIPSHIDEISRPLECPKQIVMGLALEKAMSVAREHAEDLVIASDTVVFTDVVLGKPVDLEDAKRMLKALSGKTHRVYTGIALVNWADNRKYIDFECTEVTFNALLDDEIDAYVRTGEPIDKAGAYGIQGLGALLVSHINGDYYNVMGLPLSKLNAMLKRYFQLDLLI